MWEEVGEHIAHNSGFFPRLSKWEPPGRSQEDDEKHPYHCSMGIKSKGGSIHETIILSYIAAEDGQRMRFRTE